MTSQRCLSILLILIDFAVAVERRAEPAVPFPRVTSLAEQAERIKREVSPVPTSPPTTLEMRLFERDYSLPSDYCGWNAEAKSDASTCEQLGESCVNYGSIRGCCKGALKDCASTTFFSVCIPLASQNISDTAGCLSTGTVCCDTDYPECVTIYMSSRANRDNTYTAVNCYKEGHQSTFFLQDFPPLLTTSSTKPSTSTKPSVSTTTIPPVPPPPHPTPVGAIVGGVIGGLALITLIVLGIFFYRRKRPTNGTVVEQVNPPMAEPPNPPSFVSPPMYNAQIGNPAWQPTSPDPGSPVYNPAPVQYSTMPPASPQSEQFSTVHITPEPKEVPATNPVGTGNNRAELG